ncbi:MAG: GNAT family N-acetyltransferase [Lapillicoccus sp.]
MPYAVLPPGLAADFVATPASEGDAQDIRDLFDLLVAQRTSFLGYCTLTVEDVRSWLAEPEGFQALAVIVRDRAGGPVAYYSASLEPEATWVYSAVVGHPRLAPSDLDALVDHGWEQLLAWACNTAPDPAALTVRGSRLMADEASHDRLARHGFTHRRTLWEMSGAVPPDAVEPTPAPGVAIVEPPDPRHLHAVLMAAFADHFGFDQLGFDAWLAFERCMPGHDESLWSVATVEGVPAAALVLSWRLVDDGGLYVGELATLAEFRRRGLGTLLLQHAFARARREGLDHVSLHVDSENTYDAPSLYRAVGLEVTHALAIYTRPLV